MVGTHLVHTSFHTRRYTDVIYTYIERATGSLERRFEPLPDYFRFFFFFKSRTREL